MNEPKHTPGPWSIEESVHGDNFRAISAADHGELATVVVRMSETSWDEQQVNARLAANAHLIAAAPELLEALEMFVWPYQESCRLSDPERRAKALAVIAKARGEHDAD